MLDVVAMLMSIAAVAMPIVVSMFNIVNVSLHGKFPVSCLFNNTFGDAVKIV